VTSFTAAPINQLVIIIIIIIIIIILFAQ